MKLITRVTVFIFLIIVTYIMVMTYIAPENTGIAPPTTNLKTEQEEEVSIQNFHEKTEVVVAVVVCGDRLQETLVMLKSAITFSQHVMLRIVIVTEPELIGSFNEKLLEWSKLTNGSFDFEIRRVSFPEKGGQEWKDLFKPCASQRLFFPGLLKDLDSVLYVDTDVVFLAPLDQVWSHFNKMNSSQLAALTPEHEDPNTGWYNRFAKHPYYGNLGVNSGVMLMNLTRMRDFRWESYLLPIFKEFRLKITWGDQDIINIIFHYHPEKLYIYDCRHNYRSDHCMYMSVCKEAEKTGVRVIHGSRGTFHSERILAFKAIFRAVEEFQIGTDPYQNLVLPMEGYLSHTSDTSCGKIAEVFLIEMKKYLKQAESFR